jgi:hypothetical protein
VNWNARWNSEIVYTALVEVEVTQDVYDKSTSHISYEEMYIRLRDCNVQNLGIAMNASLISYCAV